MTDTRARREAEAIRRHLGAEAPPLEALLKEPTVSDAGTMQFPVEGVAVYWLEGDGAIRYGRLPSGPMQFTSWLNGRLVEQVIENRAARRKRRKS